MRFLLLPSLLPFVVSILSLQTHSVSAAGLPRNTIYFRSETPDQPSYRDYVEHQEYKKEMKKRELKEYALKEYALQRKRPFGTPPPTYGNEKGL